MSSEFHKKSDILSIKTSLVLLNLFNSLSSSESFYTYPALDTLFPPHSLCFLSGCVK